MDAAEGFLICCLEEVVGVVSGEWEGGRSVTG